MSAEVRPPRELVWESDSRVRVGHIPFQVMIDFDTPDVGMLLYKPRRMVEEYAAIAPELSGGNVVELGIHRGGSTGFFAVVLEPRRLLAIDVMAEPARHLEDFIGMHGLTDRVVTRYGLDQADRDGLAAAVGEVFGDEPLDLVIDDASHRYGPTVASFEALFPRLRPGGWYVIEDWLPSFGLTQQFLDVCTGDLHPDADVVEERLARHLALPGTMGDRAFTEWFVRAACDEDAPDHEQVLEWFARMQTEATPALTTMHRRLAPLVAAGPAEPGPDRNLATLALDVLAGLATGAPGADRLSVTRFWLAVQRDGADLPADGFRVPRHDLLDERHLGMPWRARRPAPSRTPPGQAPS